MIKRFLVILCVMLCTGAITAKAAVEQYDSDMALQQARADIPNWMSYLPGNMFVAHVSIPGTHDTMTGHKWIDANAISTAAAAKSASTTQERTLQQQLEGGIRAFDFRPALHNNDLYCGHGMSITEVTFASAMNDLCAYLDAHPSEFFVIHLFRGNVYSKGSNISTTTKWAGGLDDDNSRATYASLLEGILNSGYVGEHVVDFSPYLKVKDVRGKIILFRRDRIDFVHLAKAANIENWTMQYVPSNPSPIKNASNPALSGILHAQDVSSPGDKDDSKDPETNLDAEKRYCLALLKDSREQLRPNLAADPAAYKPFWVMNFTSGCNANGTTNGTKGYKDNAQIMNPLAVEDIKNASVAGPTGIVYSDYVLIDKTSDGNYTTHGNSIVTTVIENNFSYAREFILDDELFSGDTSASVDLFEGKEYFLRNIATGKFLSAGADWGTHAALADNGIRVTPLHDTYSNTYSLKTTFRQYNTDNFLGDNMFIDNTQPWQLKAVYAGNGNIFYFTADVNGTTVALTPVETSGFADGTEYTVVQQPWSKGDTMQQWELITEEQLVAERALQATPANPADMTFMIRAHNFLPNDGDNSKWNLTTNSGSYWGKKVSSEILFEGTNEQTDKDLVCRAHNAQAKGASKYTNWSMAQTVSGLPEGKYTLTVQAINYSGTNLSFKVNNTDYRDRIAENSGAGNISGYDAIMKFRSDPDRHTVTIDLEITDGNLSIDMSKGGTASETTVIFDNFTLTYHGPKDMTGIEYTPQDEWDTLILPFDATIPEGWIVHSVNADYGMRQKFYFVLDKEYAEEIRANVPYLIQVPAPAARSAQYPTVTFYGVPRNDSDNYTDGIMTGSHVATTVPTGNFALTMDPDYGPCFLRVTEDDPKVLPEHRAYISDPVATQTDKLFHILVEPGPNVPTGLTGIEADVDSMVDVYSISGVLLRTAVPAGSALNTLQPGVYILRSGNVATKVAKTH